MDRLLLTLVIIFASLIAGYAFQQWVRSGRSPLNEDSMRTLRLRIQKGAMFGLIPLSAMLSLWGLPSPDARLLALPALGVAAWICGGVLALLLSRMMGFEARQAGSMFCCGTFTNIGAVGSLASVMLFGEQTIAIAALYRLCEEIYYFGIAMPVARWHGQNSEGKAHFSLRDFRLEPVLKVILCALGLGITLNLAGIPRPALFGTLSSGAMILGTVCFLLSIGMSLRLSRMTCYVRQSAAISFIKFVGCPLVIVALAMLCGLGDIDNGLPLKVVAILASMPVAMNALIPPSLFDLDLDLANACWVFTTLALIVVLPILVFVLPLL
ncbi:MAG: AEC family transporter [Mailhella sp.]|nr:AEC family transporter [Mailhella sp.]